VATVAFPVADARPGPEPAAVADAAPPPEPPPTADEPPERGLARLLGPAGPVGRPTWLEVPPERVGALLIVLADEGARLLAMTVLPPDLAPDSAGDPSAVGQRTVGQRSGVGLAAPPATLDVRYHFAVGPTPITVSTRAPLRGVPSAADLFPAMAWRERELAGEWGLRFVAAE
jgi:hypothetical protein